MVVATSRTASSNIGLKKAILFAVCVGRSLV